MSRREQTRLKTGGGEVGCTTYCYWFVGEVRLKNDAIMICVRWWMVDAPTPLVTTIVKPTNSDDEHDTCLSISRQNTKHVCGWK